MYNIKLSSKAWQEYVMPMLNLTSKVTVVALSLSLTVMGNAANILKKQNEGLSLDELVEKVQQYQKTQGIWVAQQNITNANIKNSQLWQNPNLSIERTGLKGGEEQEWNVGISQPLDIFGQRKAFKNLANIAQDQLQLKQRIYDHQLGIVVKYMWSQVMLSEVEATLLNEQLQVSQESLRVAEKRFQAGSIAQIDVDRIRFTYLDNLKLLQEAKLRLEIEQRQLANLFGQTEGENTTRSDLKSLWPDQTADLVSQNLQENVQEKVLQAQISEAKANVDVLKAQSRPNPEVTFGVKQTKTPQEGSEQQLILGVTVPLMIFNRNQYGMEIARAKENVFDKQKQFYQKQNQLEVQTLLAELKGLKQQFNLMAEQQIPLALNIQKRTLTGFQAGKLNVTDIQQATFQLHEARLQVLQLLKAAWQKSIEAESLSLGIEPSPLMAKDALNQINQTLIQDTNAIAVIGMGN